MPLSRDEIQARKSPNAGTQEFYVDRLVVPPEVIAERERRLSHGPLDVTARVFGDPPPGYSALDRKRAEPPRKKFHGYTGSKLDRIRRLLDE